jgi:hypothetical protein
VWFCRGVFSQRAAWQGQHVRSTCPFCVEAAGPSNRRRGYKRGCNLWQVQRVIIDGACSWSWWERGTQIQRSYRPRMFSAIAGPMAPMQ